MILHFLIKSKEYKHINYINIVNEKQMKLKRTRQKQISTVRHKPKL